MCSKPVKRGELLARIKAHLRVKFDATWVQSIVKGVLTEDSEAMKILESILPESIISRIQVSIWPRRYCDCSHLLPHQCCFVEAHMLAIPYLVHSSATSLQKLIFWIIIMTHL